MTLIDADAALEDAETLKEQPKAVRKQVEQALQAKSKLEATRTSQSGSTAAVAKKIKLARELSDTVGLVQAAKFKGALVCAR